MSSSIESDDIPTLQINQLMNSMKILSETNKEYNQTEEKSNDNNDKQIEEQFEDTIEEDDLDDLEGPTDEDIMNVENGVEGDED